MTVQELGRSVRFRRQQMGVSQESFAAKAGISLRKLSDTRTIKSAYFLSSSSKFFTQGSFLPQKTAWLFCPKYTLFFQFCPSDKRKQTLPSLKNGETSAILTLGVLSTYGKRSNLSGPSVGEANIFCRAPDALLRKG